MTKLKAQQDSGTLPTEDESTMPIVEALKQSMWRHWKAGLRVPQFHAAVADDCKGCTPEEFSMAARDVHNMLLDEAHKFASTAWGAPHADFHGRRNDDIPF